jgi:KipI family sensor histidine kinase inhibitor
MSPDALRIEPAGLDGFIAYLGGGVDEATLGRVTLALRALRAHFGPRLLELVPGYVSVYLRFDLLADSPERVLHEMHERLCALPASGGEEMFPCGRLHVIPVLYGAATGPDLAAVAHRGGLDPDAVIALHAGREYRVYAVGFMPGFAYLGPVDARIAVPRHATPRARVAAGSVGIAGTQTGVYPRASQGGWQIIGRTPCLPSGPGVDGGREPDRATPWEVGDRVRFEPVDSGTFQALGGTLEDACALP